MIHVIASDIQSHCAVRRKACKDRAEDQRRDDVCVAGLRKRALD
jgi:hypothetical protein